MTILSFALTALDQAAATGTRALSTSSEHLEARVLAQSLLADALRVREAKPAGSTGRHDQFTWAIEVEPVTADWTERSDKNRWAPYLVRVVVQWPRDRRIVLETVRLGAAK